MRISDWSSDVCSSDLHADAAALADRVMEDAVMPAEHAPVDMDDLAAKRRVRLHLVDDVRIAALRHEADVLAVGLLGHHKAHILGKRPHLPLRHAAEREDRKSTRLNSSH